VANKPFLVGWNDDESMARGVDVARRLLLDGVLENGVLGHALYYLASNVRRSELYDKPGPIPRDLLKKICNDRGLMIWGLAATLYGTPEQLAVNWAIVKKAFADAGGALLEEGVPGVEKTPLQHWHDHMTGQPDLTEFGLYNYVGGGGSAWFAPVVQCRGAEALKQIELMRPLLDKHGFEYIGGFLLGGRHMEHVIDLLFDRNDPARLQAAHDCFSELIDAFSRAGYGLYRTNTAFMNKVADVYGPAQKALNRRLKKAMDPNGIIAPGKSGITL
jgi:4-cresol dehydrogenase (hydroxylating)